MDTIEHSQVHIKFMEECITLAKIAMANGNFPVGSVVVKNNVIVGQV